MSHQQSALHPNGMSVYLARIPQGAHFYHGTSSPDPIVGVEWLAFEAEHALGFAHRSELGRRLPPSVGSSGAQSPLIEGDVVETAGYLHTYTAAKDLRLVYLDGMSGNKGPSGTLDAQDRILFNDSIGHSLSLGEKGDIGDPPDDQARAKLARRMAEELWDGRIDGLIRTDADFEIILCRFERDLEVVHMARTKPQRQERNARKTAAHGRFNDQAGRQVRIYFERFITAYTYDLDLFQGDSKLPRLSHVPSEELEPIRLDLTEMILDHEFSTRDSPDWRNVVGMIVGRYSTIIHSIINGRQQFTSIDEIRSELESLLEPFIDYRRPADMEGIVYRCREHYIPKADAMAEASDHEIKFTGWDPKFNC